MMKRIVILLLVATLFGCSTGDTIETSSSKEVTKQLTSDFNIVKKVKLQQFLGRIEWVVTWKGTPTKEQAHAVFERIQVYVESPLFLEEIAKKVDVEGTSKTYADVVVLFDFEQDDTYDQRFDTAYNEERSGYTNWYFSEKNDGDFVELND